MLDLGDRPAAFNFTRDVMGRWAELRPDDPAMVWTEPSGTVIERSFAEMAIAASARRRCWPRPGSGAAIPC
ncbi:hypothetical protein ACFSTI_00890 [Rhizorhabdus histidinilytica]